MQPILIFPVCLLLPHAEAPRAWSAPADYHRPSMQSAVAGLGRRILQNVSVSFTGKGSTGAPGAAEPALILRRGDRRGGAGDESAWCRVVRDNS